MYSVRGEKILRENFLEHWEGYRASGPVRIGNSAYNQFQNDIYDEVMDQAWREDCVAFTQAYGRSELDASLLIMPLVFFIAPNDPRMLSTIDAIMKPPAHGGLFSDGLVYRYPPGPKSDGLPGMEGTFNMCSFWLVEALTRAVRRIR